MTKLREFLEREYVELHGHHIEDAGGSPHWRAREAVDGFIHYVEDDLDVLVPNWYECKSVEELETCMEKYPDVLERIEEYLRWN